MLIGLNATSRGRRELLPSLGSLPGFHIVAGAEPQPKPPGVPVVSGLHRPAVSKMDEHQLPVSWLESRARVPKARLSALRIAVEARPKTPDPHATSRSWRTSLRSTNSASQRFETAAEWSTNFAPGARSTGIGRWFVGRAGGEPPDDWPRWEAVAGGIGHAASHPLYSAARLNA